MYLGGGCYRNRSIVKHPYSGKNLSEIESPRVHFYKVQSRPYGNVNEFFFMYRSNLEIMELWIFQKLFFWVCKILTLTLKGQCKPHGLGIILGDSFSKLLLHCTKRGIKVTRVTKVTMGTE